MQNQLVGLQEEKVIDWSDEYWKELYKPKNYKFNF
jgi:hypothetical protein